MRRLLTILLVLYSGAALAQFNEQYLGTKENTIRVRNDLAVDSSLVFPTDTLKSAPVGSAAVKNGFLYLKGSAGWRQAIDSTLAKVFRVAYHPMNLTKSVGQTAVFSVIVSGGKAPYKFLWQKDGVNRTADTFPSITILTTALSDTGNFRVRVIDSLNNVTYSNYANLSVISSSGGGSGVSSFSAGDLVPLFTTTEANPTTTPALSFTLSNALGNTVFGRASTTGAPSFISLDTTFIASFAAKVRSLFSAGSNVTYNAATGQISASGGGGGTLYSTTGSNTDGAMTQAATTSALAAKQNSITTGTTAQYLRGDLSLATFPTNNTAFTNGAGYLTTVDTTNISNFYLKVRSLFSISGGTYNTGTGLITVSGSLPSQTSNSGKWLKTDGTNATWNLIDTADIANFAAKVRFLVGKPIADSLAANATTFKITQKAGHVAAATTSGSTITLRAKAFQSNSPTLVIDTLVTDSSDITQFTLTAPPSTGEKWIEITTQNYTVSLSNGMVQNLIYAYPGGGGTITLPSLGSSTTDFTFSIANATTGSVSFSQSLYSTSGTSSTSLATGQSIKVGATLSKYLTLPLH